MSEHSEHGEHLRASWRTHISMEDAMRKAALQMMDLQESVAKLSAAYLEEAERNSYA